LIDFSFQGGLEFLTRPTTLSSPFYKVRPPNIPAYLPPVQMMAVDILPSSLPLDASVHFSGVLWPYIMSLVREYQGESEEDGEREALDGATVARGGELVGRHSWLEEPLMRWRESVVSSGGLAAVEAAGVIQKKKVLMLGSGMVAGSAIGELCKRRDVELLIGQFQPLRHKHDNNPFYI